MPFVAAGSRTTPWIMRLVAGNESGMTKAIVVPSAPSGVAPKICVAGSRMRGAGEYVGFTRSSGNPMGEAGGVPVGKSWPTTKSTELSKVPPGDDR